MARIAGGSGMRVRAWNRSARTAPGVEFVPLETLLAESHVLSLHLLLTDETRGFLGAERLALLRPGCILVNTARGAVVDEAAMIDALASGRIGHAALDVFDAEPLPPGHPLSQARECDAVGAQRVQDAGGQRDAAPPRAGHRLPGRGIERSAGRARLAEW